MVNTFQLQAFQDTIFVFSIWQMIQPTHNVRVLMQLYEITNKKCMYVCVCLYGHNWKQINTHMDEYMLGSVYMVGLVQTVNNCYVLTAFRHVLNHIEK